MKNMVPNYRFPFMAEHNEERAHQGKCDACDQVKTVALLRDVGPSGAALCEHCWYQEMERRLKENRMSPKTILLKFPK